MPVRATKAREIASKGPRELIWGVLRRRQSGFPSAAALGPEETLAKIRDGVKKFRCVCSFKLLAMRRNLLQ